MERWWTRDEIRAYVDGKTVQVLGMAGEVLPLPAWIGAAAAGEWHWTGEEGVANTHPDEQAALVDWFITCVERPGEIVTMLQRYWLEGVGHQSHTEGLNLAHQPEVGGVLVALTFLGPCDMGEIDDTPRQRAGDSDDVDWLLMRLDHVAHVLHAEGKVDKLLGRSIDDVVGRKFTDFLHDDAAVDMVPMWLQLLEEPGRTASTRRCLVRPDGTELWAEITYLNRFDGRPDGNVLMLAHDITERRAQEQALRDSEEENRRLADESRLLAEDFRLLAEEVPTAVFRADATGAITFHNNRWSELVAGDATVARLHDIVHRDDRRRVVEELLAMNAGRTSTGTVEARSVDGERVLAIRWRAIPAPGGARWRIVGSVDDITATVRLRDRARADRLTGLLNRDGLEEHLLATLDDADDIAADVVVVFVDLDGFKAVNDTYGHDAGDTVLCAMADRLRDAVRPDDAVARYGGDEFVLVCHDVGPGAGEALIARLRAVLDEPIGFPGGDWRPAASFGTTVPRRGDDLAAVLRRADLAMFDDKRRHRAGATRPDAPPSTWVNPMPG